MSQRQLAILTFFAAGISVGDIAGLLHLSRSTVRKHAERAYWTLGARTKSHAVALALREGLIA